MGAPPALSSLPSGDDAALFFSVCPIIKFPPGYGELDTNPLTPVEEGPTTLSEGVHTIVQQDEARIVVIADYLARPSPVINPNPLHLKIPALVQFEEGSQISINMLLDTGSEVNLIRSGLVKKSILSTSSRVIKLYTATQAVLPGGDQFVACHLHLDGLDY